ALQGAEICGTVEDRFGVRRLGDLGECLQVAVETIDGVKDVLRLSPPTHALSLVRQLQGIVGIAHQTGSAEESDRVFYFVDRWNGMVDGICRLDDLGEVSISRPSQRPQGPQR